MPDTPNTIAKLKSIESPASISYGPEERKVKQSIPQIMIMK